MRNLLPIATFLLSIIVGVILISTAVKLIRYKKERAANIPVNLKWLPRYLFSLVFMIMCLIPSLFFTVNIKNHPSAHVTESDINKSVENNTIDNTVNTINETTTQPPRLSNSCNKIMASGYDKDNNFYELVANETENYSGVNIQMGVIKNNEWLIEMNSDYPFIDDSGSLKNTKYVSCSIYDENVEFYYVGNGCFYYDEYIFNSNTKKFFSSYIDVGNGMYTKEKYINFSKDITPNENQGKILLNTIVGSELFVLDTDTMSIKKVPGDWSDNVILPYSCGLFGYIHSSGGSSKPNDGFYNLDGKKVIDLSNYKIEHNGVLIFHNNECTFEIRNNVGNLYEITIDVKGNVKRQIAK